ncbi:MAG: SGNH/GDSL hydrolase family protein [Microbacterium sp.]
MPLRRLWPIAALACVLALVVTLGVWRPWQSTLAAAEVQAAEPIVEPDRLSVPADATVLIFGDSWTYGQGATTPEGGYAYQLAELTGWTTIVDGGRGSGYLKPGIDQPTFGERMAVLDPSVPVDLIIVQGSINDRNQDLTAYPAAVDAAWHTLTSIYPDTPVVVLGPAPHELPTAETVLSIDQMLRQQAAERDWWYISPIQENWITEDNYLDIIDTSDAGKYHPSDAGHLFLAQRLADDLQAIVVDDTPASR